MIPTHSRRGASNLAVPLMIATVVVMGGFLYWLSATAVPTPPPVMEDDTAEVDAGPVATTVDPEVLARRPENFTGQMVRVENVPFVQALGDRTFFVSIPSGSLLARMSPDMVAAAQPIPSGNVTLVGRIRELSDSTVSDWIDTGSVDASFRPVLEVPTHFMALEAIRAGIAPELTADTMEQGTAPSDAGN